MAEKVTIGNAELWQGDCLEVMAGLPPMSVDAVITDPPYMIGAISTGDASAKAGGWADMENSAWWYAEWLKLARRKPSPKHVALMGMIAAMTQIRHPKEPDIE